ncbi:hypothetical protein GCM10009093_27370 [Brevundimonas terrae]|uniref:Uncharacterized protein n=1 Tax=Brevundimonas terrae TaxID=363631 RepID=A0ABP3IE26_9CAUL|nr:hypothetical protein [Brevundimonas terrae]NIJ27298.1 hypothetical protein [Brevundimonas terrae]
MTTEAIKQRLLELTITETSNARGFWLDKPWIEDARRPTLVAAAIMVVPTLHEAEQPTFPVGTGEFLQRLQALLDETTPVAVAMSSNGYVELALHSKAWRLPTLVLTTVVLPVVLGILTNRLDEVLPGHKKEDTAEIEMIVETPDRGALRVTYKGPAEDIGAALERSVARYVDTVAKPAPSSEPGAGQGEQATSDGQQPTKPTPGAPGETTKP